MSLHPDLPALIRSTSSISLRLPYQNMSVQREKPYPEHCLKFRVMSLRVRVEQWQTQTVGSCIWCSNKFSVSLVKFKKATAGGDVTKKSFP